MNSTTRILEELKTEANNPKKSKKKKPIKSVQSKNAHKSLILKSGFKNSVKNILQLLGLAILVGTTFLITMSLIVTNNRINQNYKNILNTSVQHDFIVDVSNSPRVSFDETQWIGGENIDSFSNQDLFEQYLINVLSRKGINSVNGEVTGEDYFDWSRTESRNFYGLKNQETQLNVKAISKSSLIDESRENAQEGYIPVDKIVLEDGTTQSIFSKDKEKAKRQVVLQSNFAYKNDFKIGDIIRLTPDGFGSQIHVKDDVKDLPFGNGISINDESQGIDNTNYKDQNWFEVIGFGTSADFIYPTIGAQNIITSSKTDFIAYVDPSIFGLVEQTVKNEKGEQILLYSYDLVSSKLSVQSESDREVYFSGKFINNHNINTEPYLEAFNNEWIRFGNVGTNQVKMFYKLNDPGYKWSIRTSAFSKVILSYWLISTFIIVLISIICIFSIVLIVKKQFDDAKRKLGTFKALGYSNRQLLNYFIVTPFLIAGMGVLIGYLITLLTQNFFVSIFLNYFNLQNTTLNPYVLEAIGVVIVITSILVATTFAIGYTIIDRGALILLTGNSSKKSSKVGMWFKVLFRKARPSIKLHVALTIGSFSKILGTSFTLLISTLLITISLITPDILKRNSSATFNGLNYAGTVEYTEPLVNNPATFMKTYNPSKEKEWSYSDSNIVTEIDDSTNTAKNFKTAYPVIATGNNTYKYDSDAILKDLFTDDISRNYYSYNLPILNNGDPSAYYEYGKVNYSNWKNLSLDYLKELDKLNTNLDYESSGIPYAAITALAKQWTDYKYLVDDIETTAVSLNTSATGDNYQAGLLKIALSLQNFYKKYQSGIPIKIDSQYLTGYSLNVEKIKAINFDNQLVENSTNEIYDSLKARTPLKLAIKGSNNLFYGYDIESENNNQDWNNTINNLKNDLDVTSNTIRYKGEEIETINLQNANLSNDELKEMNTYLITWYWINFEGKVGTMLLEANYQNSNNVVQNSIIQSVEKGENYNISSNVIPFDSSKEELGTMIKGIYKTSVNSQKINIYGLDKDTRAVTLTDAANVDITQNLFKNLGDQYSEYVPIVINSTVARKLSVDFKDVIDIDIIKQALLNSDDEVIGLDKVEMGIQQPYKFSSQTTNDLISEAKKNYYAYNSNNRGWNSSSTINTAKIDGYNIAASSINDVASSTQILDAVNNAAIKKESVIENKKFIVVGVAENYGESKAWISNENANKTLGYQDVKKYFFNNFFINEWRGSPALKNFYDENVMPDITAKQWTDFMTTIQVKMLEWENNIYRSGKDNPYDDFVETYLNISEEIGASLLEFKIAATYFNNLFENLYPIFNYKILLGGEYDDQMIASSKTQAYGDFSAVGLMGSSVISVDESGTSNILYTQGHEEAGTLVTNLMSNKHKTLNSIEELTQLLVYMIMFIALVISIIIIVITTSLIIEENSQFIATMKILGYSNFYVILQVSSIYLLPILIMFGCGFTLGYYMISYVINYISINYAFVIPFKFGIYIPFLVLIIMLLIYVSTISVTYKRFTRIRPTDSLQISS